jgi:CO/xanthine dehydrogenase FAD-binding subunit
MLPQFELLKPTSLEEACQLGYNLGKRARFYAGGTDVLVEMHKWQSKPGYLIDIKGLDELKGIHYSPEKGLKIGALTTHHELEVMPLIKEKYPVLLDGISRIGSVQIRQRGTIGGNICTALPSADSVAPLLVLDARVTIRGLAGQREVPLENFFVAPRQTVLEQGEILSYILVPPATRYSGAAYLKFTRRKAMDLALLGVAVYLECEPDLVRCQQARIALTTAGPTPLRAKQAESYLKGKDITDSVLQQAGVIAAAEAKPRTSWRSTAEYRQELLKVLLPRAAQIAYARLKSEG